MNKRNLKRCKIGILNHFYEFLGQPKSYNIDIQCIKNYFLKVSMSGKYSFTNN